MRNEGSGNREQGSAGLRRGGVESNWSEMRSWVSPRPVGAAAGEVERVLFDGYLYCRQMRELSAKMADFILRLDSET